MRDRKTAVNGGPPKPRDGVANTEGVSWDGFPNRDAVTARDLGSPNVTPRNPARSGIGRRATDIGPDRIITRKLVVVTVVLADALYFACDALIVDRCI
jgi:hypothetical protein